MLESPVASFKNLFVLLGFQMKRFPFLFLVLICSLPFHSTFAQSGRVKDAATTALTNDGSKTTPGNVSDPKESRPALQLYEDANTYVQKKFAEFEKRGMPYDERLEGKIKQEQRDLAARYATTLAARKLEGQDVYYLGLLYNLAWNYDAALEAMRRFLTENPKATGQPAQDARAVIVIQAAMKCLLPEPHSPLTDQPTHDPQSPHNRSPPTVCLRPC